MKRRPPPGKVSASAEPALQRAIQLHKQGLLDQAEEIYRSIRPAHPKYFEALHLLALVRAARGDHAEAFQMLSNALKAQPDDAVAWANFGLVQIALGRCEAALASFDRALALKPDYVKAFKDRGDALLDLARPEAALASFDRALALKPDDAALCNKRGVALQRLGRLAEALASYDRALALQPGDAALLNNRGSALKDLGRLAEAMSSYDQALTLKPDYAAAHDNKGLLLMALGRFDEAGDAIGRAIELAPRTVRYYYDFALLPQRAPSGNPHLPAMEELARDMAALGDEDQIALNFALAKALPASSDPERSFGHLRAGNALKRARTAYDETAALGGIDRIRSAFTAELMRRHEGQGEPSALPVFILGLPRSGTTLVEQILASHPQIFGAGEIEDFAAAAAGLTDPARQVIQSPEIISAISGSELRRLGENYLARLTPMAPLAERITNKLPENFRLAGLIHLALPNARIIHTRRDPVDTCFSCFSQLFTGNLPYTYDLAELGRYYRAYDGLMTHWRGVLPPTAMIEVRYEDLVGDIEGQARRMIAHCGLEWDARCLDFHRTERAVRTASMAQVREPLYRRSVGRWRLYERFLGPLLDALG
ncbi:MAG: hypothetical protein QOJ54_2190 [Aliidongia sp.]|nr:hypothetical protein [Aliidongia sp.]